MLCSVDKNKRSMRAPHEAESTPGDNFRALTPRLGDNRTFIKDANQTSLEALVSWSQFP